LPSASVAVAVNSTVTCSIQGLDSLSVLASKDCSTRVAVSSSPNAIDVGRR